MFDLNSLGTSDCRKLFTVTASFLFAFLVLIIELLNTSIEMVVDRIGTEFHKLSGRAKDIGSAAVCLSMVVFILVWSTVIAQNFGVLAY